ncbi:VTT domain-containing protein [Candidatus Nomurabacteria bacterium]|nr:VTT domain-containing protein [Candidatus Nomurabacteria bacterium]
MSEIIQTYSDLVKAYLEIHVSLAPLISIFLRTLAIVVAPIPGTPIDIINLAFFTKMAGFIYAEISVMLGSCINFYIGRKFGEPVVKSFIDVSKIHIWEERINKSGGFWGLVFVRMGTVLIFDYLSYVAGLTKMSFGKFFITSLLASVPPLAAFYYFGGILFEKQLFLTLVLIIPFFVLFSLFKKGKIFKKFHDYLNIKNNIGKINGFLKGGLKKE